MPVLVRVAQWAAHVRTRGVLIAAIAALVTVTSMTAAATPADAASRPKVVIVVGPAGSATGSYLSLARSYAAQARSYGAAVYEVYTPHATWARVRSAVQGANLLIYLGHGNGYPSPYGFSVYRSDGLGLNASDGSNAVAYFGTYYVSHDIRLAHNAVVILNHLCYAAGNSEPGMADPTLATARARADGFAAGFLRTNARAVFANGHGSVAHIIYDLFRTNLAMTGIFWTDPSATRSGPTTFASSQTPGKTGILDPYARGKYYHSIVGDLGMTAAQWRSGGAVATATSATTKPAATKPAATKPAAASSVRYVTGVRLNLRSGAGAGYRVVATLAPGTRLGVYRSSGSWLYVRIPDGRYGWVAGAYTRAATAAPTSSAGSTTTSSTGTRTVGVPALVLRGTPSVMGARLALLTLGTRLTVIRSAAGGWLYVRIPGGRSGWVAAAYTR